MMRRDTHNIYKVWMLTAVLLLAGGCWNLVMGQSINMNNVPIRHVMVEDLYVVPGVTQTLTFQDHDTQANLDGYIRWFVTDNVDNPDEGTISISQLSANNDRGYTEYSNGYVWYNNGYLRPDEKLCTITYNFESSDIGKYLVCDASSVFPILTYNELTPRAVSIRHIYRLKNASEISNNLNRIKTNFSELNITDQGSISSLLNKSSSEKSTYFLYQYDIHVPIESGTNYRLPMRLQNYYIGTTSATSVRWRMYDSNGENLPTSTKITDDNLLVHTFSVTSTTEAQKRYIIAEVSIDERTWYPVSFLDITLEPYANAKTQDELDSAGEEYEERKTDKLISSGRYERIVNIQFEDENEVSEQLAINDNFRKTPSSWESYYAFGEPNEYPNRYGNRVSVGRGEYALFRSLNYPRISTSSVQVTSNGYPPYGIYNDYFCSSQAGKNQYDVRAVDRLAERTNGEEYGYFMYIDANDYPGVITKISLKDQTLCAHTSLIVSAWICDLSQLDAPGYLYAPADVGFTFKRRDKNTGEETILSKFYSGVLEHKTDVTQTQALWQQVSFKFNIQDQLSENEEYLLEISNNSRSSYGADYAIDDIQVLRSLPNISVQRENACEASSLIVSSDYETLLGNMGWDVEPDVLAGISLSERDVRKYRYGIMGADPYSDSPNNYVGNVYYGFTDKMGIAGVTGSDVDDWGTINKDLTYDKENELLYRLSKTMRVAVPTSMTDNRIPDNIEDAKRDEIILNVRAINDFISDTGPKTIDGQENVTVWSSLDLQSWPSDIMTIDELKANLSKLCEISNTSNNVTGEITKVYVDNILANTNQLGDIYEKSLLALYTFLEIPRIRCPWTEDNGATICLGSIDVNNTDLKFAGEKLKDETEPASGKYEVILFGAKEIALGGSAPLFTDPCLLHSEFIVRPSITITVDGEARADGSTCLNSIHTLTADLWVADVDDVGNIISDDMFKFSEKYPYRDFTFDWFLGDMDLYENYNLSLKDYSDIQALIKACRDVMNTVGPLTSDAVRNSQFYNEHKDDAEILITLLGNGETEPLLVSGQTVMLRWVQHIIAMPYVPDFTEGNNIYSFCMEAQELELDGNPAVPGLSVGFPNVDYINEDINLNIENVPLRLGLRHINEGTSFNVPIQSEITFGVNSNIGGSLGIFPNNTSVLLRQSDNSYIPVAKLTSLSAKSNVGGELAFTFREPENDFNVSLSNLFKEGEIYSLYIPFGEYDSNDAFIQNSCEGYAVLVIKIVPEYLTWQGNGSDVWYNDDKWNQSTEEELYMNDKTSGQDANGNDEITNAFAPLYFTKITIPNGEQLTLDEPKNDVNDIVLDFGDKNSVATENIQYDMAVDNTGTDGSIEVVPYYINKVDQIYFKPEATLMNQHHLDYQKAWVDFEMEAGKPYWMSSPLKGVYAGDMYAPSSNGRQETAAFTDIYYNGIHEDGTDLNSRWNPAFYQKAWDKAITYSNSEDGTSTTSINAVKSNWSIEYNDVTVPYSLGKGFYSKVEKEDEGNVLVRLPKADTEYKYETKTRALTNTGKLPGDYGKLADESEISIDLSGDTETTQEEVDGDGTHFLVGNPYMTYLNMSEFFNENAKEDNPVLVKKYWLLENGASKAIVGTPDVEWENNETEKDPISGFIPPMTAFFVELSDNAGDDKTIKFTTDMMAAKPTPTDNVYTKSYSASNPILTLTAERGETRSVARLLTSDKGHDEYEASEDAVLLLDSELDAPMVYTVAGDVAAQFNTMQSIRNVPLGVYAAKGEEVELTIRGISQFADKLYLYDAVTRQSTPLDDDSYTFRVTGPSHGRFTLTSQNRISAESDICVYSPIAGQLLVMSSPEEALQRVQVYDMSGRMVVSRDNIRNTTCQLSLASGIYIVYAENESGNVRVKIRIR